MRQAKLSISNIGDFCLLISLSFSNLSHKTSVLNIESALHNELSLKP